MESWFTMNSVIRRLETMDTAVYLTDNAVGAKEEENLHHLIANLAGDVSRERFCPFLTTKHPFEYCMLYAARAAEAGFPALTVLGGDKHVGPPRCVPHGYVLRQHIRERFPTLALGGWANPHRDAEKQAALVGADNFTADFYLTQVVSHHHQGEVAAFLEALDRHRVDLPAVFGVFYYRSASPKTLKILSDFLPVPAEDLTRDFERGDTADAICARTIRTLRELGVRHTYISNLPTSQAAERLEAIQQLV